MAEQGGDRQCCPTACAFGASCPKRTLNTNKGLLGFRHLIGGPRPTHARKQPFDSLNSNPGLRSVLPYRSAKRNNYNRKAVEVCNNCNPRCGCSMTPISRAESSDRVRLIGTPAPSTGSTRVDQQSMSSDIRLPTIPSTVDH